MASKVVRIVGVLHQGAGGYWWITPDDDQHLLVTPTKTAQTRYAGRPLLWDVRPSRDGSAWLPTPVGIQPTRLVALQPDGRLPTGLKTKADDLRSPKRTRLPEEDRLQDAGPSSPLASDRLAEKVQVDQGRRTTAPARTKRCQSCKKTLPLSRFTAGGVRCGDCTVKIMRKRQIKPYRGGLPGSGKRS
jgi:hypothetical protein